MSYLNDLIEFHNTSALLRKKIWSFYIHLANSLYKMKDLDFVISPIQHDSQNQYGLKFIQ